MIQGKFVDEDLLLLTLQVGKKRVEALGDGRRKTIEKVFKIIKEKNVEVDLEETNAQGLPLHEDVINDRTIRRENVDLRLYKKILKSCHNSLTNTMIKSRHRSLQSKDLLLEK